MHETRKRLEYFFDFGSPTSYLAWTQLPQLAAETGADAGLAADAARRRVQGHRQRQPGDACRPRAAGWTTTWPAGPRRYGVPFRFNPHFPINTLTLMRGAAGLQMRPPDDFERYCRRGRTRDVAGRRATSAIRRCWPRRSPPPASMSRAFIALVADPEVKAQLVATTEEAVARGVFGAPTFFVGETMFFGQDRLDFVREALLALTPRAGTGRRQRSVRSFQISGNSTTSSILRR